MNTELQMESLKQNVINAINNSELSISLVYYALYPIFSEIESNYHTYTDKLIQEYNTQMQQEMTPAPTVEEIAAPECELVD